MNLQNIITARDPGDILGEGQYHFTARVGQDVLFRAFHKQIEFYVVKQHINDRAVHIN